jgi:hypothetical protein
MTDTPELLVRALGFEKERNTWADLLRDPVKVSVHIALAVDFISC